MEDLYIIWKHIRLKGDTDVILITEREARLTCRPLNLEQLQLRLFQKHNPMFHPSPS